MTLMILRSGCSPCRLDSTIRLKAYYLDTATPQRPALLKLGLAPFQTLDNLYSLFVDRYRYRGSDLAFFLVSSSRR